MRCNIIILLNLTQPKRSMQFVLLSLLLERCGKFCSFDIIDDIGEWFLERIGEGGAHVISLASLQLRINGYMYMVTRAKSSNIIMA